MQSSSLPDLSTIHGKEGSQQWISPYQPRVQSKLLDKSSSEPSSPQPRHKDTGSNKRKDSSRRDHSHTSKYSSNSYEDVSEPRWTGKLSQSTPSSSASSLSGRNWPPSKIDIRNQPEPSSYSKYTGQSMYATAPPEGYPLAAFDAASVAYVAPQQRHEAYPLDGFATPTGLTSKPRTASSAASTDDDKLDSLIRAKDELIRQKDQIIERQKKSIQQLQQQQLNLDAKLQHMLVTRSCGQEGMVTVKLQEYQCEIAQLRATIAQITSDRDVELDKLKRKLGETEYILQQMDSSVKQTAAIKEKDVDSLQQQLAEKDRRIEELNSKLESSKKDVLNSKRRAESLERYLSDVPTVEEHQKTLKTLKDVREECERLQEIITNKDKKLAHLNKAYGVKSEDLKKLHKQNKALKEKVENQEKCLEKFKANGPVSEVEYEDLKMENERLQAELSRTKKVLEAKHKKMKSFHEQSQKDQKALEERLVQEENMVVALRDEVNSRDQSIRELRKSIKEVSCQMQDLMESNLNLKSACDKYEKANSKEKREANSRLWREMARCASDLKGVVQLCSARKNGEDPNISLLFGSKGNTTVTEEFGEFTDDVDSVNKRILKLNELQTEIEALRTFISDQYAEDIGNNCTTQ
ncbi:centrosomal protein of 85 kDa isoform X2 [Nematostella vectensis]|uniref:centrosomal protein of 85 kDa isoform X2 n=1 Tax=Nematostella vectensis TaxID=45351 RepID=UPI00207704AD|nr:centrosomal protein of 85 kDa isoform X2 [Nematostella vectensis]